MTQLDSTLTIWLETYLWMMVKHNLETDGNLAPTAFMKISPLLNLPPTGRIVINESQSFDFFIAGDKNDLLAIISLDLNDKITSVNVVQSLVERWQAESVIFVTEAWIIDKSSTEIEHDPQKSLLIPPRLDPQRKEIVMISVHTPDGAWLSQTPIIRRKNRPKLPPKMEPMIYVPELQGTFTVKFS